MSNAADNEEERVRCIAHAVGLLVDTYNLWEVMRALTTTMSCGICTCSPTPEKMEEAYQIFCLLLKRQLDADWPKIQALKRERLPSPTPIWEM